MDQKRQVMEWLQEHKGELQQLVSEFVQIRSVSGEEYEMQMAVKAYAEKHGLQVEARAFDEAQKRPCILVTYPGVGGGKSLMLDAHSDTVPVQPGEKWEHDPFAGDFDGTWIHGRGSTDDKWGIAVSLMTLRALKECGVELAGDVMLLSSVGEELYAESRQQFGAGAMVRSMEKKPDFCIVCEESGKTVGIEAPRNIKFTLTVSGKAVHTCVRRRCVFPQNNGVVAGSALGVDALQKALPILEALYRLERDLSVNHRRGGLIGSGGAADGPRDSVGAVTINPMEISGGGGNSLIPSVTVKYSMQFSPAYTKEEMWQQVQQTVQGAAMADLWLRENPPSLEITSVGPGFCCDMHHPGVELLKQAHGAVMGTPGVAKAWVAGCDADAMPEVPCAVYGPTGAWAHAANERCNLQDITDAAKVYALTAMEFCGGNR